MGSIVAFIASVFRCRMQKKSAGNKPSGDKTSASGQERFIISDDRRHQHGEKASQTTSPTAVLSDAEAHDIGVEAYIYGYPLVTMEMTRRVMTNVATPHTPAPMGQFDRGARVSRCHVPGRHGANADTLYSTAWLDVAKEPWVLSVPDMDGRYFLIPMLDGWTNVFQVPGKRTTGNGAQTYAITGPGWKGQLPTGITEIKSPTGMVWILGRIYCTGTPEDYKAVPCAAGQVRACAAERLRQDAYTRRPRSIPPIDMKTAVRDQVNAIDAVEYFTLLAELMKDNPPATADAPMVAKMAQIGIVPGKDFDTASSTRPSPRTPGRPKVAFEKIMVHFKKSAAKKGSTAGCSRPRPDSMGPTTCSARSSPPSGSAPIDRRTPSTQHAEDPTPAGKPYERGRTTTSCISTRAKMPPVKGFWSLTMYDTDYFFVDNPFNRYSVSSAQRNPGKRRRLAGHLRPEPKCRSSEEQLAPCPNGRVRPHAPSLLAETEGRRDPRRPWVIPQVKNRKVTSCVCERWVCAGMCG